MKINMSKARVEGNLQDSITLDSDQKEIVNHTGNALIDAGPGAGKTRVLAGKILQLLNEDWTNNEPLVLTFSKGAAKELNSRIPIPVQTFHSFALSQLPNKRRVLPTRRVGWDIRKDLFCHMKGYTQEDYLLDSSLRQSIDSTVSIIDKYKSRLDGDISGYQKEYLIYEKLLETEGYIDFNDMLRLALQQLDKKHLYFPWIFIDEGHDTSMLQYEILKRLSTDNLWIVFSPHQMIYRWNDADERNMGRFQSDYQPKEFFLRNNYRSGTQIVKALETLYLDGLVPLGPAGTTSVISVSSNTGLSGFSSMDNKAVEIFRDYEEVQILARTNKELEDLRKRRISCNTLHSSKGTEYDTVIILNCNKDHIPHYYSSDLEEDKNLLYVGMSRAKRNLFLLYQDYPSPFIRRLRR